MTWQSSVAHLCVVEGQERTPGLNFGQMKLSTCVMWRVVLLLFYFATFTMRQFCC